MSFSVIAGDGSVTEASATTDADGHVGVAEWTLGTIAGQNVLEAAAAGLAATFTATGEPDAPASIALSHDFATLTMLGQRWPIEARVLDAYGNDTGHPVEWSTSSLHVARVIDGAVEARRAGYAEVTATTGELAVTVPVRVVPSTIDGAYQHSCGIEAGGAASCWGSDFSLQLGNGPDGDSDVATPVVSGLEWRQIATGSSYTCGPWSRVRTSD